jgi:PAS domain S-box-containing protein
MVFHEFEKEFELLQHVEEAVIIFALDGTILYANQKACRLAERPAEKIIRHSILEFLPEKLREDAIEDLQMIQPGDRVDGYIPYQIRPGKEQILYYSTKFLEWENTVIGIASLRPAQEPSRAEKPSRISVAQLLELIQIIPDAVVLADENQRIIGWNESAERLFGYPAGEALGMHLSNLIPQHFRSTHQKQIEHLLDGHPGHKFRRISVEGKALRKDGTLVSVDFSFFIWQAPEGRILGCILRDNTLREELQRRLVESEEMFRSLSEKALVGIYLIQDGVFRYVNPKLAEIFEYNREEIIDKLPVAAFVHPDDRERVSRNLSRRIEGEIPSIHYEFKGITRTGRVVDVEVYGSRTIYRGKPAVIGTLLDVTERNRLAEQLRQSEIRHRTIVEAMGEGICIVDPNEVITFVNPAFCRMLGYSTEELIGKHLSDLMPLEEFEKVLMQSEMRHRGEGSSYELKMQTRNGETRLFHVSATPRLDRDGQLVEIVGIVRDITEEREKELQLFQAQKLEALGQLVGGVAHDFNNMLTAIMGNAQLALAEIDPEHPLYPELREIYESAERAERLVQQLLAFGRKQVIQPVVLDLKDAIQDTHKMLRRLIGEDIELEIKFSDEPLTVKADPAQIEQVLINLVVNARDAIRAKERPERRKIQVSLERKQVSQRQASRIPEAEKGEYAVLRVKDWGIGIRKEHLTRIFDPFFTTKGEGKGTGIGLSTVYGIVRQNGGFIRVKSKEGQGSTFEVFWPLVPEDSAVELDRDDEAELPRGYETIVLVEDDDGARKMASSALRMLGYRVVEFSSPQEALRNLKKETAALDLLITDVVMPDMSGPELAENLQNMWPELRVLYTSGYPDQHIVHMGLIREGVQFLAKPFTLSALARKVRQVLDQSQKSELAP